MWVVLQSLSRVPLFVTSWTAARQASLSFTVSQSLLKLMSTELMMPSNYLVLCNPLLLLPSILPNIRVFSNESVHLSRWPNDWSFSFSISPSKAYSVLIATRSDWFDLLAVEGMPKSLLQHHSSRTTIIWHTAFFMLQLLYPYMITGKAIVLTRQTFVDKVIPLLFNMLSRFFTAFLPKSKHFFNVMAAVTIHSDFGAQENNVCHCFHCFFIYLPWSDGTKFHDLSFLNAGF